MIVGIFFSKPLADRLAKRNVFGFFLTLSALCLITMSFYGSGAVTPPLSLLPFTACCTASPYRFYGL